MDPVDIAAVVVAVDTPAVVDIPVVDPAVVDMQAVDPVVDIRSVEVEAVDIPVADRLDSADPDSEVECQAVDLEVRSNISLVNNNR